MKRQPAVVLLLVCLIGLLAFSNPSIAQQLGLSGHGTAGHLARWASATSLGDSTMTEDANGIIGVGGLRFANGSVQSVAVPVTTRKIQQVITPGQSIDFDLPVQDS